MFILYFPRKIISFFILIYQKTISPDHSWVKHFFPFGYCRYVPSCSDYAFQAVTRFGVIKGGYLAGKRILRCNPWQLGGLDQVPLKKENCNCLRPKNYF